MNRGLTVALLCALGADWAQAREQSHVKAELLSDYEAIAPGKTLTLGIRLRMRGGWHTYWRNPGDSGMATMVKWTLPPGFKAGELKWPYPKRFTGKRSTTFGYDDEAVLIAELSAPARIAKEPVSIEAQVDWLECKEICVEHGAKLSLSLRMKAASAPTGSSSEGVFSVARRKLPVPIGEEPFARCKARAFQDGDNVKVDIGIYPCGGGAGDFFPYDNTAVANAAARFGGYLGSGPIYGGSKTYQLIRSQDPAAATAKRLAGIFVVPHLGQAVEISIPIEQASSRRNTK